MAVVHGGTKSVGSRQSEMNDTHVSIKDLVVSGILWELVYVLNGWAPDPTGEHLFYPAVFPEIDVELVIPMARKNGENKTIVQKIILVK